MAFFWVCVVLAITYNQGAARPDSYRYSMSGESASSQEAYSMQLNEINSRYPIWPEPQLENENIFLIPQKLKVDDTITLNCTTDIAKDTSLRLALITGYRSPDYNNIACQLEIIFPPQGDQLYVALVKNGEETILHKESAKNYDTDSDISVSFQMRKQNRVTIHIGSSLLYTLNLDQDNNRESIRFLSVSGKVSKVNSLDFKFG